MNITTAWAIENDRTDEPWLVASYDEYTADNFGGVPDFYKEDLARAAGKGITIRELVIRVNDRYVERLFVAPTVDGEVASV